MTLANSFRKYCFLLLFLSLSVIAGKAESNTVRQLQDRRGEKRTAISAKETIEMCARQIRIGDPFTAVSNLLSKGFVASSTNYLGLHPFSEFLPIWPTNQVSMWQSPEVQKSGWPVIICALFEGPGRNKLVDLLLVEDHGKKPLVAGLFQENLEKVRPGMKVETMYRVLGREPCDYFKNEKGLWCVRFTYYGIRGQIYSIEADAATGLITLAEEVSI